MDTAAAMPVGGGRGRAAGWTVAAAAYKGRASDS
ncbi:hypothetical protein BU14_0058s0087 [Porphyra umbilicalis]|uniref:Uncharacterized protein n=1 Tax=Porphyra umbilicalis TaxID=2786 RepID=A0A1X6PHA6_PORUM|nr:hypothetical protein BU14_0058s0087 [Porphyra umbilicalis]|eukprot:OSX80175.1 hypothetical protein BU14_0058s0087 [Porphyra umbilicalis]